MVSILQKEKLFDAIKFQQLHIRFESSFEDIV